MRSIIIVIFLFLIIPAQAQNLKSLMDSIKQDAQKFEQNKDSANLNQFLEGVSDLFTDPENVEERKNLFSTNSKTGVLYEMDISNFRSSLPKRVAVGQPVMVGTGLRVDQALMTDEGKVILVGSSVLGSKVGDDYNAFTQSQTVLQENSESFQNMQNTETSGAIGEKIITKGKGDKNILDIAVKDGITYLLISSLQSPLMINDTEIDHFSSTLFLAKIAASGNVEFVKEVDDYLNPQSYMAIDEDDNIIIAQSKRGSREWGGVTIYDRSKPRGQQVVDTYRGIIEGGNLNLYCYDQNGNKKWQWEDANAHVRALKPAPDGGILIAGGYDKIPELFPDFPAVEDERPFVAKIKNGEVVFATPFGSSKGLNRIHALEIDKDGNIYAGGKSEELDKNIDYSKDKDYIVDEAALLVLLDANGRVLWEKMYHDDDTRERKSITDLVLWKNSLYALEYKQLKVELVEFDKQGNVRNKEETGANIFLNSNLINETRFIKKEGSEPLLLVCAVGEATVGGQVFPLKDKLVQYILTEVD